jgi:hypothetical protein
MKSAFLTCAYGSEEFHKLSLILLNSIDTNQFDLFVYTDKPDFYEVENVKVIEYHSQPHSYHHKIDAVKNIYDLGYKKILYIDSDILIFNKQFFIDFKKIEFNTGFTFTRRGFPENMEIFLSQKNYKYYRQELKKYNFNFENLTSVWEDIYVFNFENIDEVIVNKFFKNYINFTEIKHKSDILVNNERFGDQEGYSIIMSCLLSGLHYEINTEFSKIIQHLRAFNFTYDDRLKCIMNEVDFIFPYRYDTEKRKDNLLRVIEYYKKNFKDSTFIVSEQGNNQTIQIDDFNYIFIKKDLPHNQSKCINDGIKISNKKIICVIDADIILLNSYNIYIAVKEIIMNEVDYSLPYTDCFNEPDYTLREAWGTKCVGGIFIIDREKFLNVGMNNEDFEGWGREDDERHTRLINKGIKFKRLHGIIVHLEHPEQKDKDISGPKNLNLLNDNCNINKV